MLKHSFVVDFEHVFACWGIFRSNNSEEFSRRLLLTLQVHEVGKNVSSYCKRDIKMITIEAILVNLCQLWKWFCLLRKLWKPPFRKNLRNVQGKYLCRTFVTVKPFFFFALLSNCAYESEAVDLTKFILKLYLRSWSLLNLNCTHYILIGVSPNFLCSNPLINFSDTFHYYCEGKIPKIKRLNQCIKLD